MKLLTTIRARLDRWAASLDCPGDPAAACRQVLMYLALRAWSGLMNCFPVEANYVTARIIGGIWWSLRKHRLRALDNLRNAFGERYSEAELQRIGRRSFQHIASLYLVELCMTAKLVNEWSWARYIELTDLRTGLRELLLGGRGVIMVTPHFGNYELLGYTLARLGFHLYAIMRPLDNPLMNEYLMASREAGGLSLLIKKGAANRADELLATGNVVCFIADQDAGRKGVFVDFFGRPASHYKSIGLLAMQHRVPIICGYAARIRSGFRYRMCIQRVIQPEEWDRQADPLTWITQQYAAAMEAAIRRHPEQYLWAHRRWKTAPKAGRGVPAGQV